MTLRVLTEGLKMNSLSGSLDTDIRGISADSRKVSPGDLYVALKGGAHDGHDFVGDAVKKGASGVMVSKEPGAFKEYGAAVICVEDTREALACVSNNFYGRPSERLTVIGVTGTNGKTTTTYVIKSILEAAGKKAGLIGTIRYMIGDRSYPAPFTTPEAAEFQGLLSEMLGAGLTHVVTEVSSHALAQRRADCTKFSAALFTNLTRDHLDFHGTMEEYFEAKRRLFTELLSGPAVINADDPYGARLRDSLEGNVITFTAGGSADITAKNIGNTLAGLSFDMECGGETIHVESSLFGLHNVYNVLSAAGAALALGVGRDAIVAGVKDAGQVGGRFESVRAGQDFLCIVDYAHTGDALERLIRAARQITEGRVITVFGCGGQRDRGKRPVMGALATELSDVVFVTSDNPRGEDPGEIIEEIVSGVKKDNFRIVPDRRGAIALAVGMARPTDTVLIAGKGHEEYQEIKGVRYPFSDKEEAEKAVAERIKQHADL